MEAIIELILTIILAPFESKYDDMGRGIKKIPNRWVRILSWILWILIPLSLLFGLCCLCNFIFRGYWL